MSDDHPTIVDELRPDDSFPAFLGVVDETREVITSVDRQGSPVRAGKTEKVGQTFGTFRAGRQALPLGTVPTVPPARRDYVTAW